MTFVRLLLFAEGEWEKVPKGDEGWFNPLRPPPDIAHYCAFTRT